MLDTLPTTYSVAVKTPDPVVIKIVPSDATIAILAGLLFIGAMWVKRKYS